MRFEESGGFFHTRFEFDPIGFATDEDFGEARVFRVFQAYFHDVLWFNLIRHLFNLTAARMSQMNPSQRRGFAALNHIKTSAHFGNVQITR